MGKTSIEWSDYTFNPWMGCQKISPGCDHCYAEGWAKRSGVVKWGPGETRKRTSKQYWRGPPKWQRAYQRAVAKAVAKGLPMPGRPKVFCASLADVFDNAVPEHWRFDLFALIDETPDLIWQLLTKRPENIIKFLPRRRFENVWLGVTVEDQAHYDRRWPVLYRTAGAWVSRLFVSYEPAIGPLDIGDLQMPDWIICGGETGSKDARGMDPKWAYDLRAQCLDYGVPLFVKQMSRRAPIPAQLMIREFPEPRPSEVSKREQTPCAG